MKLRGVCDGNFHVFRAAHEDQALLDNRQDGTLEILFEGGHVTLDVDDPTKDSNSREVRIA